MFHTASKGPRTSRPKLQNSSFSIQNSSFLIQNSSFSIHNSSFLIQSSSVLIQTSLFLMHNSSFLLTCHRCAWDVCIKIIIFSTPFLIFNTEFIIFYSPVTDVQCLCSAYPTRLQRTQSIRRHNLIRWVYTVDLYHFAKDSAGRSTSKSKIHIQMDRF